MKNMIRWILILIGCLLPCVAVADTPAPLYTIINAITATTVKTGPGIFYGVTSTVTQTTVVTCYDNTAASGNAIYTNTPTTATPLGAPAVGITFTTGLTCIIATSVVAPGYIVLWR